MEDFEKKLNAMTAPTNNIAGPKPPSVDLPAISKKIKTSSVPSDFSGNPGRGSGIKDFLNSNSAIARVSFILLAVLIFIVVLQFCIKIIMYFFDKTGSPHLFNGMIDARQQLVIPQNPSISNAKTITRSVNGPDGIEFTWSVWIFINSLQNDKNNTQYKHIFHKGNNDISTDSKNLPGTNQPNNAPGLYISPTTNELLVIMNTYENINEEISIPNIPLNKWLNVIIRCRNTNVDVYINGTMAQSIDMGHVPKQNYGDVFVALNGGFDGYISNLWYYNYSLGTSTIQTIARTGPNIKMIDAGASTGMNLKDSKYLSLRWYFYGNQDQFN